LWNYLYDDDIDEITLQSPYLKLCLDLMFHPKTARCFYIMFIWNIFLTSVTFTLYPRFHGPSTNYIAYVIMMLVYTCAFYVSKGRFPLFLNLKDCYSSKNAAPVEQRRERATMENNDEIILMKQSLYLVTHWTSIMRRFLRGTWNECLTMISDYRVARRKKANIVRKTLSFYKWINMSLKLLKRINGPNSGNANLNHTRCKLALMFSMYCFPIYLLVQNIRNFNILYSATCAIDKSTGICKAIYVQLIGGLGGLTNWVFQSIFGVSVMISLVGLAYGADIAYRLAEVWSIKFGSLRRVNEKLDRCFIANNFSIESFESKIIEDEIEAEQYESRIGILTSVTKERINGKESHVEICETICRDATEQYLFMCELLNIAGNIWSPVLTGLIVIVIYLCVNDIAVIVILIKLDTFPIYGIIQISMYVFVRVLILLVFPVIAIAFANSYLLELNNLFETAAAEDFPTIGGRDRWVDFLNKYPAVWTYYGLYITPERLLLIGWSGFLSVVVVLLTSYISAST
jgi:hypothetical protein